MRFYLILLFTTLITTGICAQKYSNEFLSIGVGAPAHAMGQTQSAIASDVTAGFWNPAGLTNIEGGPQIAAMHAEWFAGVGKYDYIGYAQPISDGKAALGFSFIRFGIDDIPNTLSLYEDDGTINYDNVSPFSAADYALMVSYARELGKEGLSVGGTAKVINRRIGPFAKAWGFGIDAGIQYKVKNFQFGVMAKDITTTFNAWKFSFTDEEKATLDITGNDIPISSTEITRPRIILGTAYGKDFGKFGLLTALDLHMTTDGKRNVLISANPISINPSLGVEMHYNQLVYLRGGMSGFQKLKDISSNSYWSVQPSAGIGLRIKKFRVDYAFSNVADINERNYSHIVSLMWDVDLKFFKKK